MERDRARDADRHRDGVGAAEGLDDEVVQCCLAAGDPASGRPDPLTSGRPSGLANETLSAAAVPLAITVSCLTVTAACARVEVDVDELQIGAGELIDRRRVAAAEGAQVDTLDPVQIHRDRGDVAREQDAAGAG